MDGAGCLSIIALSRRSAPGAQTRSEAESARFAGMTAERKLRLAIELYWAAREPMATGLRPGRPYWMEEKIQNEVRKTFLYGAG
jgi:hypothetical protein